MQSRRVWAMKTRRVFGSNAAWSNPLPRAFGIAIVPTAFNAMTASRGQPRVPGLVRASLFPLCSLPEWPVGFVERLASRQADVIEQMLVVGQCTEHVALP